MDNEEIEEVREMILEGLHAIRNMENSSSFEWEQNFLESIDAQFGKNNSLSVKQIEKLKEIYERVVYFYSIEVAGSGYSDLY